MRSVEQVARNPNQRPKPRLSGELEFYVIGQNLT